MDEHNPQDVWIAAELDTHLQILSDQHRRFILKTLGQENPIEESDLLVRGQEQPDHIGVELHHRHLPKLDDTGYIEWDRETGNVSAGPRYSDIEPLLNLIEEHYGEYSADIS